MKLKKRVIPVLTAAGLLMTGIPLTGAVPLSMTAAAEEEAEKDMVLESDIVLDKDMTVNSNMVITDDYSIDLNGHTLTVKGNLYHLSGVLNVNGGKVKVGGNYEIRKEWHGMMSMGWNNSRGVFIMEDEKDLIDVDGDVYMQLTNECAPKAGTLRIGGKLQVERQEESEKGYKPSGEHIVEFKGDDVIHEIYYNDNKVNGLNKVSLIGNGKIKPTNSTPGFTLASDVTFEHDSGINSGEMKLDGHKLTVTGDFTQRGDGNVTVDGIMEVYGRYWHQSGNIDIWEKLNIFGNYEQFTSSMWYIYSGYGEIQWHGKNSIMDVDGDVKISTKTGTASAQKEGILRVGGDLSISSEEEGIGYAPSGDHITKFKGCNEHQISIYSGTVNHLNAVSVSDGGKLKFGNIPGFKLASDINVIGSCGISSGTLDLDGNTFSVEGSFSHGDGTVRNDGLMAVSENYYHSSGTIELNSGRLNVGGYYQMIKGGYYGEGLIQWKDDKSVMDVDGDVSIAAEKEVEASNQNAGTLIVGGKLSVYGYGYGYLPGGTHVTEFKGGKVHDYWCANLSDYNNNIKIGIDDFVRFTSTLNGISNSDRELIIADPVANVIDEYYNLAIEGLKEGVSDITFKNAETSKTSKLTVVKTNYDRFRPVAAKNSGIYTLSLDSNAMVLSGMGDDEYFNLKEPGGLVISAPDKKEVGGITLAGCSELTYAMVQSNVSKIKDMNIRNCRSLMKIVVANPECDLSGLTLVGFNGTIYGNKGSTAEAYAKEHGFNFSNTDSDIDDGKEHEKDIKISLGEDITAKQGETIYVPIYMDTSMNESSSPVYGSNVYVNTDGEFLSADDYLDPEECGFKDGRSTTSDGGFTVSAENPVRVYKMVIARNAEPGKYTLSLSSIWSGDYELEILSKQGDAEGNLPTFFNVTADECGITVEETEIYEQDDITYVIDEGKEESITISSVDEKTENLVIPADIDGIPVKTIDDKAFENSKIKTVEIPSGIETIGKESFSGTDIETVRIPDSVKEIGDAAFSDCNKLKKIDVSPANQNFSGVDGVLFNKDKSDLIQFPGGFEKTKYVIEDSVKEISNGAFSGNDRIEEITFPGSIEKIGDKAFRECKKIKNVDLPESVDSIGENAFAACEGLETITIRNPECKIFDDAATISNSVSDKTGAKAEFNGTIYGAENSTAQAYAEKYGYKFEALADPTLKGDISGNGKIDLYDAISIAEFLVKKRTFTEEEMKIADFNDDGKVNLYDAIAIATYMLKH